MTIDERIEALRTKLGLSRQEIAALRIVLRSPEERDGKRIRALLKEAEKPGKTRAKVAG
jgi:hypothetical protein